MSQHGVLAHLEEHRFCNPEAKGSSPLHSTRGQSTYTLSNGRLWLIRNGLNIRSPVAKGCVTRRRDGDMPLWWNGRHDRLRICCSVRAGSTPVKGTQVVANSWPMLSAQLSEPTLPVPTCKHHGSILVWRNQVNAQD